ncbi:MAG: flippase [Lachnospiraceae bacterium]|nr:flippase [Lachnospiraceae bacterium]
MSNKGKGSVKGNLLYNVAYQILLMITPLITSPYVSRVLGREGLGIYSYTYSMASCFAMIGMLGVTNYGNRTIAAVQFDKHERSKAFWNIYLLQIIATIISLIFYVGYVVVLCPEEYRFVSYIQILTVLCSMCDINWYFFGVEKFKLTVTRNAIVKVLNIALIFLLVKDRSDTALYTLIIVGSLLFSNLLVWPFLKNEISWVKPRFSEMKKHLKPTLVLFIPIIAITLYNRMDKVMIGALSSMTQNGLYENAEKIINIPKSLIAALGTVMLPRMSFLFANGDSKLANTYIEKSMELVCASSAALMFGVAAIAPEFVPWFFGEEFVTAAPLIMVLAPTIFFVSWANVIRTQYLIPLQFDNIYIKSVWLGAAVNLIANAFFIPLKGAMGAVIGTNLAEFSVMFYQTLKVRKELPVKFYMLKGIPYFVAGVLMFVVVRVIRTHMGESVVTVIIEILAGGCVFVISTLPVVWKRYGVDVIKMLKRK